MWRSKALASDRSAALTNRALRINDREQSYGPTGGRIPDRALTALSRYASGTNRDRSDSALSWRLLVINENRDRILNADSERGSQRTGGDWSGRK
jgi:hypothetical protein